MFDIALAPEFNCKLTASNKIPYYDVQVTDEMVQKQVEAYANRYGKMEQQPEEEKTEGEEAEKKEKKAPKIIPAEINQELFDKVFGEGTVKGEKEFREKVKADMKAQMDDDAKYRFGIDVKAAVMKKMEKVSFPEEFLKRWLKTANKELTDEQIEKEWEQTLNGLRWQLAKDQLAEQFQIKVEKADVDNLAKDFARMQFMQYGLTHIEDQYLEQFAADMLKDENQTRAIYERCLENKLYEALKGVVKLESKTISYEDFIKLH